MKLGLLSLTRLTFVGKLSIPNATLVTILIVFFEFAAGSLALGRGEAARWGLMTAAAWALFACPTMGWYTIWSPLLLQFRYHRSLLDLLLGQGDAG